MSQTDDPAVLRYTDAGLPIYREGNAPEHLATRRQLRASGLSEAGLAPVAWLHTNGWHNISRLYDRRQARPIRPLNDRQRDALAIGRVICREVNGR